MRILFNMVVIMAVDVFSSLSLFTFSRILVLNRADARAGYILVPPGCTLHHPDVFLFSRRRAMSPLYCIPPILIC